MPPDLIRLRTPMPSHAMKCGEPLPFESMLTTTFDSTTSVTIYARSTYKGRRQEVEEGPWQHSWAFEAEIQNAGSSTIQLMTRHSVATTSEGRVEEVKLPPLLPLVTAHVVPT